MQIYEAFIILVFLALLAGSLAPGRKPRERRAGKYAPRVLVIVPCKGTDIQLARNLIAAGNQDYGRYDIIVVADSARDPSMREIRKAGLKHITLDFESNGSRKVRSLSTALSRYRSYDAYALLDSDVLVGPDWLRELVAPLSDRKVGISTTFPVFEPVGKGFWSRAKKAWGFVGQSLMRSDRTAFGWGGSLAFRRSLISGKEDFRYFSNSISDDVALSNISKRKGLRIAYVESATPIVQVKESASSFFEWSTRQTVFALIGNPSLFYYGVAFYTASALLELSAIVMAVLVSPLFLLLITPIIIRAIKLHSVSGDAALLPMPFMMDFIYLFNMLRAKSMSTITWRGVKYSVGR